MTATPHALRADPSALLEAAGIRKSFPGVVALDGVSLRLRAGEIHALLGENGAGKSTLIKVLTGVYHADEGELLLGGEPASFGSPRAALAAGISVVHQERNLIPQFTVAENKHNRRPDVVLFVNGIPLAVVELKNAADENTTIWTAFQQLQTTKPRSRCSLPRTRC